MAVKTAFDFLEDVLESLPEEGPIAREEVRTWVLFHKYMVNLLEEQGLFWRGQSFKNNGWAVLLVVKIARQGNAYVCFVTAKTPTDCMRIFLKRLAAEEVSWKPDQYA